MSSYIILVVEAVLENFGLKTVSKNLLNTDFFLKKTNFNSKQKPFKYSLTFTEYFVICPKKQRIICETDQSGKLGKYVMQMYREMNNL